jgi:hypothetical protein
LFLTVGQVYSQLDKNGNPVFNSITTQEESFKGFKLISNYYTLENNIDNTKSSVYVSKKPTIAEREKFATDLPSDFFLVSKKHGISNLILLQTVPKNQFLVVNLKAKKEKVFSTKLKGEITENRASELFNSGLDSKSRIGNGKLYFNNKTFNIISNESIKKAVKKLIKKEKLDRTAPSESIVLSQSDLQEKILSETKKGGQLDFFTEIEGKEFNAVLIKKGVISTNLEMALYKWGRATYELGLNTFEDSYVVFSKYKKRELNKRITSYKKWI